MHLGPLRGVTRSANDRTASDPARSGASAAISRAWRWCSIMPVTNAASAWFHEPSSGAPA
ncbi:hypothetical protein IU11_07705 [Cellulosimicrobium sp. MM]|nr:hypothetical protein [Cellulosimicrobium sp. MM]KFD43863.1 hypothetical protein IU11_07705 [Cellulosimicrobium sp. MM]